MAIRRFASCLLAGLLLGSVLVAQTSANKSSIGGIVTDSTAAPIPGATITVSSDATGISREAVTNSTGAYEITALDPGTYSLKVTSGSAGASINSIALNIGASVRVNVRLSLQANLQSIDLSTSTVSATETGTSELIDQDVIQNLSVNGRRFQDFAQLAPATEALTQTKGQLSFSGQRGIYSNVMVEGSDYNEPFLGGIRGGQRSQYAFTIPQSAIQEFQVVESGYGVEYGRSSGGMLNVLTQSGSNAWHGAGFYQLRPHGLSAANPYGLSSLDNQHQFGGSVGGPVKRDKLFIFLASEWQLSTFPQHVQFPQVDALAGQVTPGIGPAWNYFRSLEGTYRQTNDIGSAFGRIDYQFSPSNRIAIRYNHSQNRANNALLSDFTPESETNRALSANGNLQDYTDTASGQLTTLLRGAVNAMRVEYSRERQPSTSNAASPYVSAGSIGVFGSDPSLPSSLSDYRFQFSDVVSFTKGRHNLSAGGDYSFVSASSLAGANQYGSFVINSSDVQSILQMLSGVSVNRFDDPTVSYLRQVGDLKLGANAHQAAIFAQDNWRISPAFSVNFGLRWEGQINPSPKTDNSFLIQNVLNFNFPLGRVDPTLIRSPLNQWAPRAGFAWNPGGRSDTVIRAFGGLFYAQTPLSLYAGPINNFSSTPSDLTLQIAPIGGSTVYQQFLAGGFNLNAGPLSGLPVFSVPDVWINVAGKPNPFAQANVITTSGNNFRNPRTAQVSLIAQHEFSHGVVIDYQLNHLEAVGLERNVDFNTPVPFVQPGDLSLRPFFGLESGVPRPNPNLGAVIVRDASARSNYTGNTLRIRYRTRTLQLAAHYTLSYNKSNDDNEGNINSIAYQNPFNFSRDYNRSSRWRRSAGTRAASAPSPAALPLRSQGPVVHDFQNYLHIRRCGSSTAGKETGESGIHAHHESRSPQIRQPGRDA